MSAQSRLASLISAIGADIKSIKTSVTTLQADTGWLASGVFASSGATLTSQQCRIKNGIAYVTAFMTLPAIVVPTNNDIGNVTVLTIVDPRFIPDVVAGAFPSNIGRPAVFAIYTSGVVNLTAIAGSVNVPAGDASSFYAVYPVD